MAQRRTRALSRKQPRHVVGSWIWVVLTPQIEHCHYELGVLRESLTFRAHSRRFERLLPLREALTADGHHVFDDLVGEIAGYDSAVEVHDEALLGLLQRADALYSALVTNSEFLQAFDEVAAEVWKTNERDAPAPDSRSAWVGYVAADVVNDLTPDLSSMTSEWAIWNRGAARFKALAPSDAAAALADQRSRFKSAVEATQKTLFTIRKGLSRQYDLPVVPIPGAGVEDPMD